MSSFLNDSIVDRIQDHAYTLHDALQPGCPITHGTELTSAHGVSRLYFDSLEAARAYIQYCSERIQLLDAKLWDLQKPDVNLMMPVKLPLAECSRCQTKLLPEQTVTRTFGDESEDYCDVCYDDLYPDNLF